MLIKFERNRGYQFKKEEDIEDDYVKRIINRYSRLKDIDVRDCVWFLIKRTTEGDYRFANKRGQILNVVFPHNKMKERDFTSQIIIGDKDNLK